MLRWMIVILSLCLSVVSFAHDAVWQKLQAGNQRFYTNKSIAYDSLSALHKWKKTQKPQAVVLSCMDSRVPPEVVFDQPLGNLFVVRNAGNVENPDVLASLEYATAVVNTPLLVVMGHSSCGAMHAACEGADVGNVTQLVDRLQPVVKRVEAKMKTKNCDDPKLINAIAKANVRFQIRRIRQESPVVNQLVKNGHLKIIGAYFNLKTGKVETVD